MSKQKLYDIRLYLPDGSTKSTYANVKDFKSFVGGGLYFETEDGIKIWTTLPSFITEMK